MVHGRQKVAECLDARLKRGSVRFYPVLQPTEEGIAQVPDLRSNVRAQLGAHLAERYVHGHQTANSFAHLAVRLCQ